MNKNTGSNHTDVVPAKHIAGYKVIAKIDETLHSFY
jgi:hypothetical protein